MFNHSSLICSQLWKPTIFLYLLRILVNFNGLGRIQFLQNLWKHDRSQRVKRGRNTCLHHGLQQNRVLESTPRNCSNVIRLFGSRVSSQRFLKLHPCWCVISAQLLKNNNPAQVLSLDYVNRRRRTTGIPQSFAFTTIVSKFHVTSSVSLGYDRASFCHKWRLHWKRASLQNALLGG